MSMRCAVVATSVGGIPEVVRNGRNGSLVQPGHPGRLAHAVDSLLQRREEMVRYGREARRTVVEGFSIRRMSRQLEAMYLQLAVGSGNGERVERYGSGHNGNGRQHAR
jgi:glycosyltransferase involved in cell wall biosynthesis